MAFEQLTEMYNLWEVVVFHFSNDTCPVQQCLDKHCFHRGGLNSFEDFDVCDEVTDSIDGSLKVVDEMMIDHIGFCALQESNQDHWFVDLQFAAFPDIVVPDKLVKSAQSTEMILAS